MKNKKNNNNTTKNENNNTGAKSHDELLRDLDVQNMRIALLYIVVISLFLDLTFASNTRLEILDSLNGTSCADKSTYLQHYPYMSRNLTIFVAIVLVRNRLNDLNYILCAHPNDEEGILNAQKSVMASILAFLATITAPAPSIAPANAVQS